VSEQGITGQQMCEAISRHWADAFDHHVEPERIWNYSPTGELSEVYHWYAQASAAGYGAGQ
jgi:hypothetical protein